MVGSQQFGNERRFLSDVAFFFLEKNTMPHFLEGLVTGLPQEATTWYIGTHLPGEQSSYHSLEETGKL